MILNNVELPKRKNCFLLGDKQSGIAQKTSFGQFQIMTSFGQFHFVYRPKVFIAQKKIDKQSGIAHKNSTLFIAQF